MRNKRKKRRKQNERYDVVLVRYADNAKSSQHYNHQLNDNERISTMAKMDNLVLVEPNLDNNIIGKGQVNIKPVPIIVLVIQKEPYVLECYC
jgi:hypothetical protein